MEAGDPQELTCSSCPLFPYEEEGPGGIGLVWAQLGCHPPFVFFLFIPLFFVEKKREDKKGKLGHKKL